MNTSSLSLLKERAEKVLFDNILPFWLEKVFNNEGKFFYHAVDNYGNPVNYEKKSLILYSRILWTFSFLYRIYRDDKYLELANASYDFIMKNFIDTEYGGVYWMLSEDNRPVDTSKKIYGHAYLIYALSEYYDITGNGKIYDELNFFYSIVEEKFLDRENDGYFETFARDWSKSSDMRLSDKDMNVEKSMNSHLHLMEAFTNMYRVTKLKSVKSRLFNIVELMRRYIILPNGHLGLFFDSKWDLKSSKISFGHDIECSWLLTEAMDYLDDYIHEDLKNKAISLAEATLKYGFTENNSIINEKDENEAESCNLEWWMQAEAVIGLINAYQLTGDSKYFEKAILAWNFIENYIVDWKYGEWFYEVSKNGEPNMSRLKVNEWKGPYHNVRACVNIILRIESLKMSKGKKDDAARI